MSNNTFTLRYNPAGTLIQLITPSGFRGHWVNLHEVASVDYQGLTYYAMHNSGELAEVGIQSKCAFTIINQSTTVAKSGDIVIQETVIDEDEREQDYGEVNDSASDKLHGTNDLFGFLPEP